MPSAHIVKTSRILPSARVQQMAGIFDVPPSEESRVEIPVSMDLPGIWNVGIILGPSGSGKSTVAKELFGEQMCNGFEWPSDRSILDSFPEEMGIKEITAILSSVGFSSPPNWLRPFGVLSNGEQFRATMARAIASNAGLLVFDEFTSVVDRTVAKIGSAAIQKTIRRRNQQFIAVSCHYDIAEWLEPDWIYQPHLDKFEITSGRLRRPQIVIEIRRVHPSAWRIFKQHHYLSATLNTHAQCFVGFVEGEPAVFIAYLPFVGHLDGFRKGRRIHRLVCLPDFQGVGIGAAITRHTSMMMAALDLRVFLKTSHPAEIASKRKSSEWKITRCGINTGRDTKKHKSMGASRVINRLAVSFEFIGEKMERSEAERLSGNFPLTPTGGLQSFVG